ncbi:hypothetical protein AWE51_04785 [Aquimarina aggregata]|uniref:Auto-transporter adhesin head GIN domain-containing protein n=1 Tax=Aquimarina aggregata TaxID=1642818 RepID=A0A162CPM4_9FLAO|nr:hypothetical protein [Aquimarina aggregata]KZS40274.1 hypothetical protein AWE51_04785 [Aquimarina aggregata]
MKKLNVLFLAIIIAVSSVAHANTNPSTTENVLTQEIKGLLKKPNFKITNELIADVILTINDENEIVVLSVDSESEVLENYIKGRLNYKKVHTSFSSDKVTFKLPVRLVEE